MESLKSLINTKKSGNAVDARHQRCEEMREEALTKCTCRCSLIHGCAVLEGVDMTFAVVVAGPRVSFLVNIMEKMGCKMDAGFYSSVECEGQINGGFHLDEAGKPGVVLCQNHIQDQEWMDRTLAHELIHAYDHCRSKMDWNNCEQHACSEIRAAALSGDCNWKYEFFRKNFNIAKQHQICTRRRAKLSIQHNEACKGKEAVAMAEVIAAAAAVDDAPEVSSSTATPTENASEDSGVAHKKRRVERREKLRKTAICKHFDKPGGCPFPDCKFAHGRSDVKDGGMLTVAAQRKLIREQTIARTEGKFLASTAAASPASLRGTMIERYYTELFSCDTMDKKMEDQYVHMHSNRLCVVGVAASHPVMNEEIEAIEFSSSVLESKVSGKKKKGGQFMVPTTILCQIKCKSGQSYAIRSCIRGALIEVNEKLLARPQLLQEKVSFLHAFVFPLLAFARLGAEDGISFVKQNDSDGYLVIIQPKQIEVAEIQESLLSKDEYLQFRSIVAAADDASAKAAAEAAAVHGETDATPTKQEQEAASGTPLDQ